ncbi:MAG: hypothetical protein U0736_17210 [Gemmataceae bacterium]
MPAWRRRRHGHLTLHQQDAVGLVTYDNAVRQLIRPASQPSHLKGLVTLLNKGPGSGRTALAPIFHDLAERITRRGIIVVLSDCFDEADDILNGLKHLRHKRHEVIVMQVLDPAELDFPFQDATLFRGLEQEPELLTDPRSLRESYLEHLNAFLDRLHTGCLMQNIDHLRLRTDASLGKVLAGYLARRLARTS